MDTAEYDCTAPGDTGQRQRHQEHCPLNFEERAKAMLTAWVRSAGVSAVEEMTGKDRELGIDRARGRDGLTGTKSRSRSSTKPSTHAPGAPSTTNICLPAFPACGCSGTCLATWPARRNPRTGPTASRRSGCAGASSPALSPVPVLFINPIEKLVATVAEYGQRLEEARRRHGWWRDAARVDVRFSDGWEWGDRRIAVDSLDSCCLDPVRGLVTPTIRMVGASRARVAAAASSTARSAASSVQVPAIASRQGSGSERKVELS
jgi:hypothetical protein